MKPSYFGLAASLRSRLFADFSLQGRERRVIGIAGESGSGKSVTAQCLAEELAREGIPTGVIHQDDYFYLPPRANHENRCVDLRNVGPREVDLDLLRSHIGAFRAGLADVTAPLVDYPSDSFLAQRFDFSKAVVLIVEGTYVLPLEDIDIRIFLRATHEETRERRRARNRDIDAPIVDSVLKIEHAIISSQVQLADIVISREFMIEIGTRPR